MCPNTNPYASRLGESLRMLMARRGLNGLQVASNSGITPSAFSRILKGKVRPRQGTFSKFLEILCRTPDEQQLLISSYSSLPDAVAEALPTPISPDGKLLSGEMDRIARYLELKTMSIDFRESVARALQESGIVFESYFRRGNVVTDFLVSAPTKAAIECKFNVNRDWEREVGTAYLLRATLGCERVFIVVPYVNELANRVSNALACQAASVVTAQDLICAIRAHGSGDIPQKAAKK